MEKPNRSTNFQKNGKKTKYSRLTAQIIRGTVKRKILDIRKRKLDAANELLDSIEDMLANNCPQTGPTTRKNHSKIEYNVDPKENGAIYEEIAATLAEGIALADKLKNGTSNISFEQLLLNTIRSNREEWSRFILSVAENFDAESLSCFGTNLIYGGLTTERAGNSAACSFVELSEPITSHKADKIREIVRRDQASGRRIMIIRGYGLLCPSLIGIYRFFSDTAFILIDSSNEKQQSASGAYNVLIIPEGKDQKPFIDTKRSPLNGLFVLNGTSDQENIIERTAGKGSHAKLTYGGLSSQFSGISRLFSLFSSPSLPITLDIDEFLGLSCQLESIISYGLNRYPETYNF